MSNAIARLACGALMLAALAGTAQAGVVYRGGFDPASYNGIATFDVAPDCVPGAGFTGFTFPDSDCGPVDFLSGTVHDDANTSTITFGRQDDVASALRWALGVLIGLDTTLITSQTGISGTFPLGFPPYALQFSAGSSGEEGSSPPSVQLFSCSDGCFPLDGTATQFPYTVVSGVPEPGSLALIGCAIVAGWAARRRRS